MGNAASSCVQCASYSDDGRLVLCAAEQGALRQLDEALAGDIGLVKFRSVMGGNTPWHKAAKAGSTAALALMAEQLSGHFEAGAAGEEAALKDLGGDEAPALRVSKWGASPEEVMRKLLNASNHRGATALMLAARGGHADAADFLCRHGAEVFKRDRARRQTALHYAAEAGHVDVMRVMLRHAGARVNRHKKRLVDAGNHAGLTALHYAAHCGHLDAMRALLGADANINAQADYPDLDWVDVNAGDTAMHIAAAAGNVEAIRLLLKAHHERGGAMVPSLGGPQARRERRLRDPRVMRNDYGRLPYHVAMRKGFTWLQETLDPSVPVRYLLTGEELDTTGEWGPPRLAVLAAKALHAKLVADLARIAAAQAAPGGGGGAGAAAAPAPAAGASGRASFEGDGAGAAELARARSGQQRSGAGAAWERSRRSLSTSLHEIGALLRSGSSRAPSGAGGRSGGGGGGGGGSGGGGSGEGSPGARLSSSSSGMGGAAGALAAITDDSEPASPSNVDTSACVTLRVPSGTSGGAGGRPHPFGALAAIAAADDDDEAGSSHGGGATCAVIVGTSDGGGARGRPGCDKVSPGGPELLIGAGGAASGGAGGAPAAELLGALTKPFRRSSRVLPAAALSRRGSDASLAAGGASAAASSAQDDALTCGVCLDLRPDTAMVPCGHRMCAGCAGDVVSRCSMTTAACPFCRTVVAGFELAPRGGGAGAGGE